MPTSLNSAINAFSSSAPRAIKMLQGSVKSLRTPPLEQKARAEVAEIPIIAFCHLSWKWVWQRPQQFLSRLALTHKVLFVETFCTDTPHAFTHLYRPVENPGVTVLEMHLPRLRWHDGTFIDLERRRILREMMAGELGGQFNRPILWFNDPMAVTAFAGNFDERLIIYDCMDELSQFAGAPPALLEREHQLLLAADVVFCGGRKMRDKRLPVNDNCHFYGTGVDCEHFGRALTDELKESPDTAQIEGKILGYFGVIDERLDYELIARLADAQPDWTIVMVGPVAKVDPRHFPQRPNLRWIGPRNYQDLPALTKGFDVCMMPFARNAATQYINPTKALEYMAAGRPVVSTALDEVRTNFADVARVAETHEEFITLCREEANRPSGARIRRGLRLARENTWEAIAAKMNGHMADVLVPAGMGESMSEPTESAESVEISRPAYV